MNILVIRHNVWDDSNAGGNTLSNFFSGLDEANLSYLYSRKAIPNNKICSHYFTIPEKDILLNFFSREKIGHEFNFSHDVVRNENTKDKFEESVLKKLKKFDSGILRLLIDFLWISKRWYNKNYRNFIQKTNPDIVFAYATNFSRLYALLDSIKTITNTKIVLFITDDVTVKTKRGIFHHIHWKLGQKYLKKCIDISSNCYGITPALCSEYQNKFNKSFHLLRKGCDLSSTQVKSYVGNPLKLVYAGNLYYGRDKSLIYLINIIDEINRTSNCQVFALAIYSNSIVPRKLGNCIADSPSVQILGVKPYSEIMNILAESDLVLHIESFSEKAIEYTRLSFSTKITDCMQSGSCLLAIGPDTVASMQEIQQIPGAIAITDINDLKPILVGIAENPNQLLQRAKSIQKHAHAMFSVEMVRESLRSDFQRLIDKNNSLEERTV